MLRDLSSTVLKLSFLELSFPGWSLTENNTKKKMSKVNLDHEMD